MGRWNTYTFGSHFSDDAQLSLAMNEFRRCYAMGLPGVYAIFIDNQLKYIGSSGNLASRLLAHKRFYPIGHEITIKISHSRMAGDWLMREYRLIKRLRPMFNLYYNSKAA